jgi:multicomponent K+:H+ antiporter subunit D
MFLFLLTGLNGAFLTGDLFNLFVWFELLLAASYGLVLHGSGTRRVRAGLHYIAINLATSLLFLIGVSLIYGVTGTLNMADLAIRIPHVSIESRGLLEAGAAMLGIAFLVKAGMWPLSFWLPTAYSAAAPPIAAMFSVMSKLGVYVVLRLWLLLFGADSGASANFGGDWLTFAGMATIVFGTIGVLASQDIARLASFCVLISSGTVMAAIAIGQAGVTGPALYYLVSSTLAVGALFMLVELLERGREPGADVLAVTREAYGDDAEYHLQADEVGVAIPAVITILSLCFIGCTLVLAGLPPLSGFIAKFAVLTALFGWPGVDLKVGVSALTWTLLLLLIFSGLTTLVAMTRAGIRTLWTRDERTVPRVRVVEIAPIVILLLATATLTVRAEPVMRYMQATADSLHAPHGYIQGVLSTPSRALHPRRGLMTRWLPFPLLSTCLMGMWLLLNQTLSLGHILLGGLLAVFGGWLMTALQPAAGRMRNPRAIVTLVFLVLIDIIRSNFAVARIILGTRHRSIVSGFLNIPLDMRDRYGLAVLACIITATPGTLWVQYNPKTGMLMIHVLDLVDESVWIDTIKGRYERLLLEIFK